MSVPPGRLSPRAATVAAAALVGAAGLLVSTAACDPRPTPPDEPFLAEIVPASGPAGARVELRGAGFGDDPEVARVLFAGMTADIDPMLYTDGFVTVTVPPIEPGTWAVVIEIEGVVSEAVFFTVTPD